MTAINRKIVRIAIMEAATNAATLADSDYITGEIKSYSKSGGDLDVESDPHFGGDVDKEKARSQFELTFEITPSIDDTTKWEAYSYGSATVGSDTIYLSSIAATDKAVFIEAAGTSNDISWGFDNCNVTLLDMEHNADDNQTKTLSLKFGSENSNGRANFMAAALLVESMPAWTALPNGS